MCGKWGQVTDHYCQLTFSLRVQENEISDVDHCTSVMGTVVKLDFAIAVDLQTRAYDQTFGHVLDHVFVCHVIFGLKSRNCLNMTKPRFRVLYL